MAHSFEPQIAQMSEMIQLARSIGGDDLEAHANFNLYMLLFYRDLQYTFSDALFENDPLKRNLYARHLAIALSDFLQRANAVVNRGIRSEIEASSYTSMVKHELRDLGRYLSRLDDQHREQLKIIRNTVAAHRDADGLEQLGVLSKTDVETILQVTSEVSEACKTLLAAWSLAVHSWQRSSKIEI